MTRKPWNRMLLVATVAWSALLPAACAGPEFRDAFQVEGAWVGNRSWSASECVDHPCERLANVAAAQLLRREPAVRIHDVRFHAPPHQLADGRSMFSTLEIWNVVFTLEDGSRRLEAFSCHLGNLASGASVYGPFCSPREESSLGRP